MAVRVLWSREEAVILLDALIQTLDGRVDRSTAVQNVSNELRSRAVRSGQVIDDIFRNTNGISLQMRSMEYLFTKGMHGLNKSVRVFQEVVDLYTHNRGLYEKILKDAKEMPTNKSIEEQFAQWLSEKVNPGQLSELYMSFPDIESFCLERKILRKRLFETTDPIIVKLVVDTVNSNRVFRFNYKKSIKKAGTAIKLYYDFVKSYAVSEKQSTCSSEHSEPTGMGASSETQEHRMPGKAVGEQKTQFVVDFTGFKDLASSAPYEMSYFDEVVSVDSWAEAYTRTVSFLLEDYPKTIRALSNQVVAGKSHSDFADAIGAQEMIAAKKVADDVFVETNLSANDIVGKIRYILDLCNIDYENLIIRYTRKESSVAASEAQHEVRNESKTSADVDVSGERVKFIEWMKNAGIAMGTVFGYLSAINQCEKAMRSYGVTDEALLTITNVDSLVLYRDCLFAKTDFKIINEQQHNRYRAAYNKLIDYRSAGNPIKLSVVPQMLQEPTKGIPKIEIPDFSKSNTSVSDPQHDRFDAILREHFSEGLLPNALRLDKFRMLYENAYGTELVQDDDVLVSQLKAAGSFIDSRIYPKQDTKQNSVVGEVLTEIINTLNNGAQCVFLSCVMERWQQELANQLNVYNEGTLRSLLVSQNVKGLFITETVLKATAQNVNPERDIIAVMKDNHYSMTYQQIQEKIWYIPLEEIKHALVTTPEIVNVESETYFYAPNFPASSQELQYLKMCMKSELAMKGYLVAPDIGKIIREQCRTIAINTADYKDWAYRNVLKYIFRDDFQFNGAVVSEKGKPLELWQVYRNYCRDHEQTTLEELNALKDELGATIYWDTVLAEMVRVNVGELIRRDLVHFDVEATDKVLDDMCPGDYVALKDISLFLHFPPVEYPWNEFVLESYLQNSKAFKLYHASYANHGAFGVIVRTNTKFEDYRAVVVDMLAHSDEWRTSKEALELIVDKGYQARKRWTNFEQVAQEASLIRERIKAERM